MNQYDYSYAEIIDSYKSLGIEEGDLLFVTTGLGFLGRLKDVTSLEKLCSIHVDALKHVVGPTGGIIVPTYSYTFGSSTPLTTALYSPNQTSSKIGPFPNYVIKDPSFKRSIDPMVSSGIYGDHWQYLISNLPHTSYGFGSIFHRLLETKTKLLSIGLGPNWTPFLHYLDYVNSADYRYDKIFYGIINGYRDNTPLHWNYSVSRSLPRGTGNCQKLGYLADLAGIWSSTKVGKGSIYTCSYYDYYSFAQSIWGKHMWLTTLNHSGLAPNTLTTPTLSSCSKSISEPSFLQSSAHLKSPNAIAGVSLQEIFNHLKDSLKSSRIDYISLKTGSNLGNYVIPEAWIPCTLEIYLGDKIIFESRQPEVIKSLVLPHSKNIDASLDAQALHYCSASHIQHEHKLTSLHSVIYLASSTPLFIVSDKFFQYLNLDASSKVHIKFTAEYTFSSLESILISPYNSKHAHSKVWIIDTISNNLLDLDINHRVTELLNQGDSFIFAPSLLAPYIFEHNYNYTNSDFQILTIESAPVDHSLKDITKVSFNPTPRLDTAQIDTLDFGLT